MNLDLMVIATFVGVMTLLGFRLSDVVRQWHTRQVIRKIAENHTVLEEKEVWAKTVDELPPMAEIVATWDGEKVREGYLQYVGIDGNPARGWILFECGEAKMVRDTVTHWARLDLYLPDPPEEENPCE